MIPLTTVNFLFAHQVPRRVLDIGTQNMLHASEEAFCEFLDKHGNTGDHRAAAADMAHRSVVRPGETTLYLSEVLAHTSIDYVSFDICPGHRTEIFDLNREKLPSSYEGQFDLILNCGTSEHILNQLNLFSVVHDAARVGAFIYHQVPTTGRIDHGYFCYHPLLFRDLARANGYEIIDLWYKRGFKKNPATGEVEPRSSSMAETGIEVRGKNGVHMEIPNHAICVLFRKVRPGPFQFPLEITTRHAEPDETAVEFYGSDQFTKSKRSPRWLSRSGLRRALSNWRARHVGTDLRKS